MKNKYLAKRVFAVILAASMCVTAAPLPVMAEDAPVQQQEIEVGQTDANKEVPGEADSEKKTEDSTESKEEKGSDVEDKSSNADKKEKSKVTANKKEDSKENQTPQDETKNDIQTVEAPETKENPVVELNGNEVSKADLKSIFTEMGISYPALGTTQLRNVSTKDEIEIAKGIIASGSCTLVTGTYEVRTKTAFSSWETQATVDIKVFYNVSFNVEGAPGAGIIVNGEEVSAVKVYENQPLVFQTKEVAGYEATVKNGETVLEPGEDGNYTINPTANTTISVVYEAKEGSKVTVTKPENGTVKVNGAEVGEFVIVPYGGEIKIEATPAEGYAVDEILLNDKKAEATFENCIGTVTTTAEADTDYTVNVTFQKVELKAKADLTVSWREGQDAALTEQRIFNTVLDTENSVPSGITQEDVKIEYDAEHMSGTVWKTIDYIPSGLNKVHEHAFGNNPRNIIEKVEDIRITYAGDDRYPSVALEAKIYLDDTREASKIEVTEGASITYSSDEETVKDALYQALNPVVKDATTEEVIQTESKDFTFEYDKLAVGTVNVTVKYNGNDDYDSAEISVDVSVTKAKAKAIVNSQNITYGEKFAPVFSSDPADANIIGVIAGFSAEGAGYVSVDFGSITVNDLAGKEIPVIGDWSLQKVLVDMNINNFQLRELTDVIQKIIDFLDKFGISLGDFSELISGINEAITLIDKFAPGILNTTVSFGGTPENAGVYMAAGVTINQNYRTAVGVGMLTVSPQVSDLEIRFDQELPEGSKIKLADVEDFDFGGKLYENGELVPEDKTNIKTTYVGAKWNGVPVVSSEPVKEAGTYVETVFVWFGNHAVCPISRTYTIEREETTIEIANKYVNATYDGNPHGLEVTLCGEDGEPIEGLTATVEYRNLLPNYEVSNEAPVDGGWYLATAKFSGNDQYKRADLKTGFVTIDRVKYAEVQILDQDTIYGDPLKEAVYNDTYEITDAKIPQKDRVGILKEIHCEDENHPVGEHKIVGTLRDGLNRNYKHIEVLPGTHTVAAKDVLVDFVDENGNLVFSTNVKKDSGDPKVFEKSELEDYVPTGWELVGQDAIEITENSSEDVRSFTATALVREESYLKNVTVKYVTETGEEVGEREILTIEKSCKYIETSWLEKVPEFYEIVNEGQVEIIDGVATVEVRKTMKTIMVNFVDEKGNPVFSKDIEVESDATEFAVSLIKDFVPSGWELKDEGNIAINEDNTATVVVCEKEYQKDVLVNYVDEEGNLVLTSSIKVIKESTEINTSWLKDVPYGWELVSEGNLPIKDNAVTVVVREKEYQKDILVNYVDEEGNLVLTSSIKVSKDSTHVSPSWLKDVPYGWELVSEEDLPIKDNAVTVVVREKEYQKDVLVNYVDEKGNLVLTSSIKVSKDSTHVSPSWLKDIPYGWELVSEEDLPIKDNAVTVVVREKEYQKEVTVKYVTEAGKEVGTEKVTVAKESTTINTSWLKAVPKYYELVEAGNFPINENNVAEVLVRKTMKTVMVNFVDESGNPVFSTDIKVESDATSFNTDLIKDLVPSGWELKKVGKIAINKDNTATVVLKAKEYTKEVTVKYVTKAGKVVGTEELTVMKESTAINTKWLKAVPKHYELVRVGNFQIGRHNTVKVPVRKTMKNVIVNFVNEAGCPVFSTDIKVESDATYFNTDLIKDLVPSGWELKKVGKIAINKDNTATVVLREKEYTKEVTVKYVTEAGKVVGSERVTVAKESTAINTSWLKAVPKHYELAEVGDFPIGKHNTVKVPVRKAMKNVIVNFVDEAGNPVLSADLKVESDATYFNTSLLKNLVPSGWELVEVGDIAINKDNTATVKVREKEYTEDIVVKYVTEDGKEIAEGTLKVEKGSTSINTSWLQDVPEGYEIAIVGDLPIEDGIVKVVVRVIEDPEEPEDPDVPDVPEDPDKPEDPDTPEDPDKPVNPDKPDKPNKPAKPNKPSDSKKPTDSNKAPKTGDEAPIGLLGFGLVASLAAIAAIIVAKKKK